MGSEGAAVEGLFGGGTVLCDGAMGSMLYARGIYINRCYDELNVLQPEIVREVHTEYLQAGASVIETNTFGANAIRLERYGLEGRVWELNVAGVRLARECVGRMREKQGSEAFVAGAMGPLGVRVGEGAKVSAGEAYAAFAQQVKALAEGGPSVGADLLVIETMTSMVEAEQAIEGSQAGRRRAAGDRDGDRGRGWKLPGRDDGRGRGEAADGVGRGCGGMQLQRGAGDCAGCD